MVMLHVQEIKINSIHKTRKMLKAQAHESITDDQNIQISKIKYVDLKMKI